MQTDHSVSIEDEYVREHQQQHHMTTHCTLLVIECPAEVETPETANESAQAIVSNILEQISEEAEDL